VYAHNVVLYIVDGTCEKPFVVCITCDMHVIQVCIEPRCDAVIHSIAEGIRQHCRIG
jgi:hypothetical protein